MALAGEAQRGGQVRGFLADVQADRALSKETRAALIEAGRRIQDALR